MSEAKFVELQGELFRLFELGKFDDVHALIHKAQMEYPERLDKTSFWKACVLTLQGEQEKAIAVLDEALQKGVWWNPLTLTRNPDLVSLQNLEEFRLIVNKCEDILEKHNRTSQSQLFVYGNPKSDIGIFSLHWRGSSVKDFAPYWLNESLLRQYIFGFPQSSQVYGYNAFCWDDEGIAVDEISKTFAEFREKYNTNREILAGASQGGKLAIELCLNKNPLGVKGFIVVIPAIRDVSEIESLLKTKSNTDIKGCIITGDADTFYDKTIELKPIFEAHDLQCKWIVKKGLGHFFSDDFTTLLEEAIDFILQT
jgi:predicted esterase